MTSWQASPKGLHNARHNYHYVLRYRRYVTIQTLHNVLLRPANNSVSPVCVMSPKLNGASNFACFFFASSWPFVAGLDWVLALRGGAFFRHGTAPSPLWRGFVWKVKIAANMSDDIIYIGFFILAITAGIAGGYLLPCTRSVSAS